MGSSTERFSFSSSPTSWGESLAPRTWKPEALVTPRAGPGSRPPLPPLSVAAQLPKRLPLGGNILICGAPSKALASAAIIGEFFLPLNPPELDHGHAPRGGELWPLHRLPFTLLSPPAPAREQTPPHTHTHTFPLPSANSSGSQKDGGARGREGKAMRQGSR